MILCLLQKDQKRLTMGARKPPPDCLVEVLAEGETRITIQSTAPPEWFDYRQAQRWFQRGQEILDALPDPSPDMDRDETVQYFREILGLPPRSKSAIKDLLWDTRESLVNLEINDCDEAIAAVWPGRENRNRERVQRALRRVHCMPAEWTATERHQGAREMLNLPPRRRYRGKGSRPPEIVVWHDDLTILRVNCIDCRREEQRPFELVEVFADGDRVRARTREAPPSCLPEEARRWKARARRALDSLPPIPVGFTTAEAVRYFQSFLSLLPESQPIEPMERRDAPEPLLPLSPPPGSPNWQLHQDRLRGFLGQFEIMAPKMTAAQRRQYLEEKLNVNLSDPQTLLGVWPYLGLQEVMEE